MARRALGPATLTVVQALDAALTASDIALVVACSGGADSLALAYATHHVGVRRKLPYSAVVVDHQLQPDSQAVTARVRDQLVAAGIADVAVIPVVVDRGSAAGLEAAARDARYAALDAQSHLRSATVLLGHTLDDQAETVLLGLARGSGPRSLAGMAVRSGRRLRPLLGIRRTLTHQVCAELGWSPWADPHNLDPRFTRTRVRHRVLPILEAELGPGVAEALARTAALAQEDSTLLDRLAAEADPGTDELAVPDLAALPAALRSRVIRRWLTRHGVAGLERDHVLGVEALVLDWHGQTRVDLPGAGVQRSQGSLQIRR